MDVIVADLLVPPAAPSCRKNGPVPDAVDILSAEDVQDRIVRWHVGLVPSLLALSLNSRSCLVTEVSHGIRAGTWTRGAARVEEGLEEGQKVRFPLYRVLALRNI